jgi:purine-binding chemotaxis protein CheW
LDSIAPTLEELATPTLLFRVGGVTYGCDVTHLQEIIPLRKMTRLPGAPACVRGLINMRGTIMTVLDLGVRLDPACPAVTNGSIVVLGMRERLVGILVEEVTDMRSIASSDDAIVATEGSPWGSPGSVVQGVATIDETAVVMLDLEALVTQVLLF